MAELYDPDGHRWVRPTGADCPHCPCCTKRLCETARQHILQSCAHVAARQDFEAVKNCPCQNIPWPEPQTERAEACTWCNGEYRDPCSCAAWCGQEQCQGNTMPNGGKQQ